MPIYHDVACRIKVFSQNYARQDLVTICNFLSIESQYFSLLTINDLHMCLQWYLCMMTSDTILIGHLISYTSCLLFLFGNLPHRNFTHGWFSYIYTLGYYIHLYYQNEIIFIATHDQRESHKKMALTLLQEMTSTKHHHWFKPKNNTLRY